MQRILVPYMKNFAFIYFSFKVQNIYQILRFYSWFAYKNQTFHYTVLTNGRGVLCPDWYNLLYRNTRPSCNIVIVCYKTNLSL